MPDSKSISQMTTAEQTSANDLFETAMANGALGYLSRKVSLDEISKFIANVQQYSNSLNTTSKTLTGAINEVLQSAGGGVAVTGTLTAGSTSITLSNVAILTTSTIDIYTDVWGVNPTSVSLITGSITLTFDAQANDLAVKVVVK